MSLSRNDLAENISRLKDNGHWRHYVGTLEETYNRQVEMLLMSDHPDEASRGECRAYLKLLKLIHKNQGTPT
jgi:hypothetical protein